MLPNIGRMQERLGGDTSHMEASASQLGIFFNNSGAKPILRRPHRCGVAARATAYDYEIEPHEPFILTGCGMAQAPDPRRIRQVHAPVQVAEYSQVNSPVVPS